MELNLGSIRKSCKKFRWVTDDESPKKTDNITCCFAAQRNGSLCNLDHHRLNILSSTVIIWRTKEIFNYTGMLNGGHDLTIETLRKATLGDVHMV